MGCNDEISWKGKCAYWLLIIGIMIICVGVFTTYTDTYNELLSKKSNPDLSASFSYSWLTVGTVSSLASVGLWSHALRKWHKANKPENDDSPVDAVTSAQGHDSQQEEQNETTTVESEAGKIPPGHWVYFGLLFLAVALMIIFAFVAVDNHLEEGLKNKWVNVENNWAQYWSLIFGFCSMVGLWYGSVNSIASADVYDCFRNHTSNEMDEKTKILIRQQQAKIHDFEAEAEARTEAEAQARTRQLEAEAAARLRRFEAEAARNQQYSASPTMIPTTTPADTPGPSAQEETTYPGEQLHRLASASSRSRSVEEVNDGISSVRQEYGWRERGSDSRSVKGSRVSGSLGSIFPPGPSTSRVDFKPFRSHDRDGDDRNILSASDSKAQELISEVKNSMGKVDRKINDVPGGHRLDLPVLNQIGDEILNVIAKLIPHGAEWYEAFLKRMIDVRPKGAPASE